MGVIEGVVEAIRKDGKGFKVGEAWYGAFNATELSHVVRGDTVRFEFARRGEYNNIKGKVEKVAAAATSSGRSFDVQDAIIRQNALTNAVNYSVGILSSSTFPGISDVIATAQRFEEYTSGKLAAPDSGALSGAPEEAF